MADVLAPDLRDFLRAAARRPFSWSEHDCLSWLGDWVAVRHGVNLADPLRERYASRSGAYRLIAEHGSRVALLDAVVAPLGLCRTEAPVAGDIALVEAPEGELGAIVTGRFAACIGLGGLRYRQAPIVAAWRV